MVFIQSGLTTFIIASLILVATGGAAVHFSARLGFLLTSCLWLTACLLGALPLYFSQLPLSFAQAVFESVSGVTSTGATMLVGLDTLPRGILLWRSLLCWIGGVGFIALALLILPSLRIGGIKLFHMESSDRSEKVLPRIHQVANAIIIAYVSLTVICALCYFTGGMSLFDAINHAMSTVATAGFSTHDASLGFFKGNTTILFVAAIFMIFSALPFVVYIKALLPRRRQRFFDPQIKLFITLIVGCSFILGVWLHFSRSIPFHQALPNATFHFVSVITTTGYAIEDYSLWGPFAFGIFFLASFMGGCSGSTSGGMKISRLIILWYLIIANLTKFLSPNAVIKIRYGNSEVSAEIAQRVLLFLCLYMISTIIGTVLLITAGLDFISAFTGALAALSNVGIAFGNTISPVDNFSTINDTALWILNFLMLTGRLEIMTIFILFTPVFWRR
ncbi:MAG: trk system potassium uptake protein TrkH [Candidatus Tokpelaia sp. JSC189]|nr:MAG: trk system potassium uptake protein TrkH [Candidatus Tokpelaia sp. JSC189]